MIAKLTIAACLMACSAMAFCEESKVQKCQMNVMSIKGGMMIGEPRTVGEALVTSGLDQFYAVIDDRVIKSPLLIERKGDMVAYHSGAVYLMQKSSYSVLYEDFGYVFDECVKVA